MPDVDDHECSVALKLLPWQFLTERGLTLRGVYSPPSGKPLLHFLHGNGFCGLVYEPMLTVLSKHFDLWISDAPGHGDSDAGDKFPGWNQCAKMAGQAFLHHLHLFSNVQRYAVGHSFGGILTGLIVAKHPQLFQRAVLLDPVLFPPAMLLAGSATQWLGMGRFLPLARSSSQRRSHWPSRQAAIDTLLNRGTYKNWTQSAMHAFGQHALKEDENNQGVVLKCSPKREAEIFSSVPKNMWRLLSRVNTPTRVLYAKKSFPFIATSAVQWSSLNPAVTAKQVDGNHCFMQCNPDMAAHEIESFLL